MRTREGRAPRRLRRTARELGKDVAEELLLEVAWRVLTAPFRSIVRGLLNGVDAISP